MISIGNLKILVLIPARMGSTRFPNKPMAKILDKPMIGHVYENILVDDCFKNVVVATCDEIIYDYIVSIGGRAIMTSNKHNRASDRCAEALLKIENEDNIKYDIVIMVQGDEPMVHHEMLLQSIMPIIEDDSVLVTNLLGKIQTKKEFNDNNCIKVVCDLDDNALYFSREPIPTSMHNENIPMGKQICIIPFRRDFLLKYIKLKETPLEIAESIDMNRILEHGYKVKMVPTNYNTHAVDTPKDLKKVEKMLEKGKR